MESCFHNCFRWLNLCRSKCFIIVNFLTCFFKYPPFENTSSHEQRRRMRVSRLWNLSSKSSGKQVESSSTVCSSLRLPKRCCGKSLYKVILESFPLNASWVSSDHHQSRNNLLSQFIFSQITFNNPIMHNDFNKNA